jgi:hypothetical protein
VTQAKRLLPATTCAYRSRPLVAGELILRTEDQQGEYRVIGLYQVRVGFDPVEALNGFLGDHEVRYLDESGLVAMPDLDDMWETLELYELVRRVPCAELWIDLSHPRLMDNSPRATMILEKR